MKLLTTTAFLLMALANVSYGQNNNQLGFICLYKANPNGGKVAAKVDMRGTSAEVFNWDTETFNSWTLRKTVNWISLYNNFNLSYFYINRTSLDGGPLENSGTYGCTLNTWSEVNALVQREISRLNETRAF